MGGGVREVNQMSPQTVLQVVKYIFKKLG